MATNVLQKAAGANPTEMADSQVVDDGVGVGVGVASPAAKLHVLSATEQLRLGNTTANYLTATVSAAGFATLDAVGSVPSNAGIQLNLGAGQRMKLTNNTVEWDVDNVPALDNTYNDGTGSRRWKLVRGVTITSGDLRFENDLVLTEHYNVGTGLPRGVALVDDRDPTAPTLLAFFAADGSVYADQFRSLRDLPGTVRVVPRDVRTARSLEELAELNG